MDIEIVRLIELPYKIPAVTALDYDGNYNIYINSLLSQEEQLKAYKHERKHIDGGHFYSRLSVFDCEAIANEGC